MGLSGSKTTTKPVYSAQIEGAAGSLSDAYKANQPAIQGIASGIQGLVPDLISRYQEGNPAVRAATGYATDVIGGKYLTGNPQLDQIIANTNSDVANKVNASLGTRGRTGGDVQTSLLTKALAQNETGLRYGDYSAERDRMAQAAGMAPGLAAAEYAGISPVLAAAEAGTGIPLNAAGQYAQGIGGLLGQYTTTKQQQGLGSALGGLLGAGLSGWASGGFGGLGSLFGGGATSGLSGAGSLLGRYV